MEGGRNKSRCSPSLIRRILQTVPTVLAVVLVVFVLFSVVPGSIVSSMSDDGRGSADPPVVERMKKQLGLDDPVYVRFGAYVAQARDRRFRHLVPDPRAGHDHDRQADVADAATDLRRHGVCDRDRRAARFRRGAAAGRHRRHGLDGRGGVGPFNGQILARAAADVPVCAEARLAAEFRLWRRRAANI